MLDMQSILQHSDFTEFKTRCCKYIKTCHGTPMVFIFLHPLEDPFCPLPLLKWSGIKMQSPTARLFFNCISCNYLRQCSTTTAVYDLSPSKKNTKYHSDSYEPSERIDPLLHHGFRGAQYGGSDGNWMGTSILGASITWDPSSASIVYIPRCSTVYVSFASRNGPSSQSYKSAIHGACSMTW